MSADVNPLGPLTPAFADPAITEVVVNGGGEVWVERNGRLRRVADVLDVDERLALLERLLVPLGRRLDRLSPVVDARLPDGSGVPLWRRPTPSGATAARWWRSARRDPAPRPPAQRWR